MVGSPFIDLNLKNSSKMNWCIRSLFVLNLLILEKEMFTLQVSKKSLRSSLTSVDGLFFRPLRNAKKLLFLLISRSENFMDSLVGSLKLDSNIVFSVNITSRFSLSSLNNLDLRKSVQTLSHSDSSHFRFAATVDTMKGLTVPVS